jgi:uncharacterized membrane protein YeiB
MSHSPILHKNRIKGYDFAKGIAVFGMFLMNFKIVMQDPNNEINEFWELLLQGCEGRFGALFVILSGIGVSLFTKKARLEKTLRRPKRFWMRIITDLKNLRNAFWNTWLFRPW